MACPTFSKHNLGLRPLPTTFQLNKNKHRFKEKSLTDLRKNEQNKVSKCNNGEPRSKGLVHLLVWSEQQCQMEPKNAKNGDLGLEKCKPLSLHFLNEGGGGFG